MEALLGPASLLREIEALSAGEFLQNPADLIAEGLALLRPPEKISTVECAEQYRKFRTTEGGALVPYDRKRTPYNIAKMNALDNPAVNLVVVVKPSRSGGTTVAENYLFKLMLFGPMGDVGWYLGSDTAVKKYCDRVIKPMFDDHPLLMAKVGAGRSDNNDTSKRVSGHLIEWLPANDSGFRNREFVFGVADEPDGWTKYSETPVTQLEGRQKNVGKRAKRMVMSHPDKGWKAGTAAAWERTSRGIYIMRCIHCERFAAAHATKYWPDVPEFKLTYDRDLFEPDPANPGRQRLVKKHEDLSLDERLELAERTAGMLCPHCGAMIDDEDRFAMIEEAGDKDWWLHRGQTLDPDMGIQGEMLPTTEFGFWDHGLMLKVSRIKELARGLEEALTKYERSGGRNVKVLKEYLSKQLGEVFEGKSGIDGVTASTLRSRDSDVPKPDIGTFPADAMFITAAVDVGKRKFDVSFRGWDCEGRSWWLDRLTYRQLPGANGRMRDIATRERIDDWNVLIDEVILRLFPIAGRANALMPVAQTVIDVSDGNVTWIGREFAARTIRQGMIWGTRAKPWARVQLIQGSPSAKAQELPPKPRISDDKGRVFPKGVQEWTLGVHKLKELALERLAITDGGPGQCYFADGIDSRYFEEYFNEPLIEGKFERQGDNESLDLFAYEEAARLMLKPDRKDIHWDEEHRRPVWARPVPLQPEGGDQKTTGGEEPAPKPAPQRTARDRFQALANRRT
ncbi:terminase gpA endonuclease subunit [Caenibius sp. WL]|uniref:terminase gpA endonuclease subunit n=1 Tax=Caenibius sp. WL TaxID=2872646 RepID=UPI001C99C33F|nr:terminase gpA endonuclease subunit [Caenibius sp. WL]QZP06808.1 phage terminase large subunit family protein [Caenibius sp. WL]